MVGRSDPEPCWRHIRDMGISYLVAVYVHPPLGTHLTQPVWTSPDLSARKGVGGWSGSTLALLALWWAGMGRV